jgi:molybdopterin-guanine dinucleotide biosynthesis protein A
MMTAVTGLLGFFMLPVYHRSRASGPLEHAAHTQAADKIACMTGFDAIVLAGGRGRRLGGADKAALQVGTRSLLDRSLDAVRDAAQIVVVGPDRDLPDGVLGTCEDPPGGGPVAGIAAALTAVRSPLVVVLACDMPFVTDHAVERLVATAGETGTDGALLVDPAGRRQFLAAVYNVPALRRAIRAVGRPQGAAMREVVRRLTITEVSADPEVTLDCDTWEDVERSRDLLEER